MRAQRSRDGKVPDYSDNMGDNVRIDQSTDKRRPADSEFVLRPPCASLTLCLLPFLHFAASSSPYEMTFRACVAHSLAYCCLQFSALFVYGDQLEKRQPVAESCCWMWKDSSLNPLNCPAGNSRA